MATPTYPSLDATATQAAVYPSEQQLWNVGPTINDPGDQGVMPDLGPMTNPTQAEDWLHEVLNGETSNQVWEESVVNPRPFGPTGFGPWTDEGQFQTGHSQNVVSNPAAEQGWGVGPARRWAHFPIEDSPNPARNMGQAHRDGQYAYVSDETKLYYRTQLAWEQQWAPFKRRSPVAPIVPVASSVPFSSTVPTYGGGPAPIPGVDVPQDDSLAYGIYPS